MNRIWGRVKEFFTKNFLGSFLAVALGGLLVALGLKTAEDKKIRKTVDKVKEDLETLDAEGMIKEHATRTEELTQQSKDEIARANAMVEEAKKAVQEAIESAKTAREVLDRNKKESEQLQKEAEALKQEAKKKADKLNKIISGTLIVLLSLGALFYMPTVVHAQQVPPSSDKSTVEPAIPKDYDTLLKYYIELLDVAVWYKAAFEQMSDKYAKAEAGRVEVMHQLELQIEKNATLTATIEGLNQTIKVLTLRVDTLTTELARQREESAKAIAEYRESVNILLEQINKLMSRNRTYPLEIKGEVRYDGSSQSIKPYIVVEFKPSSLLDMLGR